VQLLLLAVVLAQTCQVCGEIRGVREVRASEERAPAPAAVSVGTSSGLDTPPVVGTVAQFRFDRGRAYDGEGWAIGGAAGTPEMQARLGETTYELTVAMDLGETRTLRRADGARFHIGQRVALRGGNLEPM
jgi:outer membrane lipoprotein SlyB